MDVTKLLGELKAERDQIEDAITKLERLLQGRGKRRGRPPAWQTMEVPVSAVKRRGRPLGSKNRARTAEETAPPDNGATGASGA